MSDMNIKFGTATSLVDLLSKSKQTTSELINVATLARIKSISEEFDESIGYGKLVVTPFPIDTNNEISLEVYAITDREYEENDLVVILFMDSDFRNNLKYGSTPIKVTSTTKHSKMYGVIVAPTEKK